MSDNKYTLERKLVTASKMELAESSVTYWENKTPEERLNAACFIINSIFGVTAKTKVEVSVISRRKHKNG